MSHFTVLVTKTNKVCAEEQLAPFDEGIEAPQYIKRTKEQLIADERTRFEEYLTTTYSKFLDDPVAYKASTKNPAHINYLENEFPKRLHWTDEDFYKEAIRFYEKEDVTPEGGIYSTYNPKSKRDWYKVGGRWAGYFKLKSGGSGIRGTNGLANSYRSEDGADIALARDIDWQAMSDEKRREAERNWNEFVTKLASGERVDPDWDYDIKRGETKEQYIKRTGAVHTFAVLHNGEWYEKGEMGWWASVSNEKSPEDWQIQFDKIIASLDPDDEVTVVDCHI